MIFTGYGFTANVHSLDPMYTNPSGLKQIDINDGIIDTVQMSKNPNAVLSEWAIDTVFLAEFMNNFIAGNLPYSLSQLEKIAIKRRKSHDFNWITLKEYPITDETSLTFLFDDLLTESNTEYEYAFVPITSGGIEGNYMSTTILSMFNGIYVLEKDIIYPCDLNASLSTTRNVTTTVTPTLGRKYPFVNKLGKSDYISGQAEATFIHMNYDCSLDIQGGNVYRQKIGDFLTNGNPKIIKYDDGRIYLIGITGQISESIDVWEAPKWSFEFTCIGDPNNEDDLRNSGF